MNNTHINEVFEGFAPSDIQKRRVLFAIQHPQEQSKKVSHLRKPLMLASAFILIFALVMGVFPILQRNSEKGIELAFTGLTITAYAAEIDKGAITFDVQLFQEFNRVEISVSCGNIFLADDKSKTQSQMVTVHGNRTFVWEYGSMENAVMSFRAFDEKEAVVSEGSLDLSSGELTVKKLTSYPQMQD